MSNLVNLAHLYLALKADVERLDRTKETIEQKLRGAHDGIRKTIADAGQRLGANVPVRVVVVGTKSVRFSQVKLDGGGVRVNVEVLEVEDGSDEIEKVASSLRAKAALAGAKLGEEVRAATTLPDVDEIAYQTLDDMKTEEREKRNRDAVEESR